MILRNLLNRARHIKNFPKYYRKYPSTSAELQKSKLYNSWWYYAIELLPGMVTKGIYPTDLPLLPRKLMRQCDLKGMACLDLGSMEGLMPVLMCRGGASSVMSLDAIDHCLEKINAVKYYYKVNYIYKSVGLMYELYKKLNGLSFDFINCSGMLYHVFSPMTMLAGIRPLLKKNGMIIVSTNVILEDGYLMEFNNSGRMQVEENTFWYLSIKFFDYMLRYMKLSPVSCLYIDHQNVNSNIRFIFNKPSGYLSVLCRAIDEVLPLAEDDWMVRSAKQSWEYQGLSNWPMAEAQPSSKIRCSHNTECQTVKNGLLYLDLWNAVRNNQTAQKAEKTADTHMLKLEDNT